MLFSSFAWRKGSLRVCSISLLLAFTAFFSSCSRSNNIPDPPHLKTQLVSELFASLRQENWAIALEKINRIRELAPEDTALSGIEVTIKNNITIHNAQEKLDKGDIDAAIKIINDFMTKNGQTVDFRDAMKELNALKEIRNLSEAVAEEEDSVRLAYATAKLNKSISKYPEAKELKLFADKNVARIYELKNKERLMGLDDLRADIDTQWIKNDENIDTLLAMFEAINPDDDLPLAYKKGLAENWDSLNFNDNYLNTNLQYIFFRMILTTTDDQNRNDLMHKLVALEPNNYRTTLMKAFMLNLLGKIDDSMTILSAVKTDLAISDAQYKSWFVLSPKNIGIYKINPFALSPFFVYIPDVVKFTIKQ